MQILNIKIKRPQMVILSAVFLGLLTCMVFATPAQAASVKELCQGKQRPSACEKAVKKSCDSKTSGKEDCQKKRADDFKAKKTASSNGGAVVISAQHEGTDGGVCGNENSGSSVETKFNFGCLGNDGPDSMGAIEDLLYSLIRFLSVGVGVVLVMFIILAGIQYSASEGNPEATQGAKNKIRDAIIGLFIYLIAFAFVQFLVPGGIFAGTMFVPDTTHYIIQRIL